MADANPAAVKRPSLDRSTLAEQMANLLEDRIERGELASGDRLPSERVMVDEFGVSRIVIREAMRILKERGLATVRSGAGARVVQVSAESVTKPFARYIRHNQVSASDLFAVRKALEVDIAGIAADSRGEADIKVIRKNLTETRLIVSALASGPGADSADLRERFSRVDLQFHQLLCDATSNPLFRVALDPLSDALLEVRRVGVMVSDGAERALVDHERIAEAVFDGAVDTAREAMTEHLDRIFSIVSDGFDVKGKDRHE